MSSDSALFEATWPAVPRSVAHARHDVIEALVAHATADQPLSDIRLVVSEAVSNAINHAFIDREPGQVKVRIRADEGELELMVEDDGTGMAPRPDSPGLGLGLPLIATLCSRFDIHTTARGGTRLCAWFLQDPAAATLPASPA